MFKLEKQRRYINVQFNNQRIAEFPVPDNRKYPETKEDVKKALIKSIKKIEREFRYVIGIIHFANSQMLRPIKKSVWFKELVPVYWQIFNLFPYLGIHPIQADDQDSDSSWIKELD